MGYPLPADTMRVLRVDATDLVALRLCRPAGAAELDDPVGRRAAALAAGRLAVFETVQVTSPPTRARWSPTATTSRR
jgi:hypothetical protein